MSALAKMIREETLKTNEETVKNADGSVTIIRSREIQDKNGAVRTEINTETTGCQIDLKSSYKKADTKYNSEEVNVVKKGGKEITTRTRVQKDSEGGITKTTIKEIKNRDGTILVETNVEKMNPTTSDDLSSVLPSLLVNNENMTNKKSSLVVDPLVRDVQFQSDEHKMAKTELNVELTNVTEHKTSNSFETFLKSSIIGKLIKNDIEATVESKEVSFESAVVETSKNLEKVEEPFVFVEKEAVENKVELKEEINAEPCHKAVFDLVDRVKVAALLVSQGSAVEKNELKTEIPEEASEPSKTVVVEPVVAVDKIETPKEASVASVIAEPLKEVPVVELAAKVEVPTAAAKETITSDKVELKEESPKEASVASVIAEPSKEEVVAKASVEKVEEKIVPTSDMLRTLPQQNDSSIPVPLAIHVGTVDGLIKKKYVHDYQLTDEQYQLIKEYFNRFQKDDLIPKSLLKGHLLQVLSNKKKVVAKEADIANALDVIDVDSNDLDFDEFIDFMTLFFASKFNLKNRITNVLNGHQFTHAKHGSLTPDEADKYQTFLIKFFNSKSIECLKNEFKDELVYSEFAIYVKPKLVDNVFVKH